MTRLLLIGGGVCPISVSDLLKAKEMMDAQPVPVDVVRLDNFTKEQIDKLRTGELGTLHGFEIKHSSIDEMPVLPQRHDWWNQGRKY